MADLDAYLAADRTVKMATTYVRKAEGALTWTEWDRIPPGYWDLVEAMLAAAIEIVGRIPDDYFETSAGTDLFGILAAIGGEPQPVNLSDTLVEQAEKLVEALRARRVGVVTQKKIDALENVTGRTPEEAALYQEKAAELRGKR